MFKGVHGLCHKQLTLQQQWLHGAPLCRRQQSVFDGIYSRLEGQLAAAREQAAALQEAASAAEAAHGQARAEVASLQAQGDAEQVRQHEVRPP